MTEDRKAEIVEWAQEYFTGWVTGFTETPIEAVWRLFCQRLGHVPTPDEAATFRDTWAAQYKAWKDLEAWREGRA